jgi:hypothetical protein
MQENKEWSLNYDKTDQYKNLHKNSHRSGNDEGGKNSHILSAAPQLNIISLSFCII